LTARHAQVGDGQLIDGPSCLYACARHHHVQSAERGQYSIGQGGNGILVGDVACVAQRGTAGLGCQLPGFLLAARR
jgi:hypothetical protein